MTALLIRTEPKRPSVCGDYVAMYGVRGGLDTLWRNANVAFIAAELQRLGRNTGRCPMESRDSVLEAVRKQRKSLRDVGEVWRSDHEV
eukprot:3184582-Amphidinium_carterae.1